MREWWFGRLVLIMLLATTLVACGTEDDADSAPGSDTNAATTAGSGAGSSTSVDLAPELASIDGWHNTEPLSLEALRGSPVLIVFWSDT